jgi:hypothetical protein
MSDKQTQEEFEELLTELGELDAEHDREMVARSQRGADLPAAKGDAIKPQGDNRTVGW